MDTKTKIIQTTFDLFADKGYRTSMSDISNALGIRTPSIYNHFENKNDLIGTTIEQEFTSFFEKLLQKFDETTDQPVEEQLETLLFYVLDYFQQKKRIRFWRQIPLLESSPLREKCEMMVRHYDDLFSKRIRRIIERGVAQSRIQSSDIDGTVFLYFSLTQGLLDALLLGNHDFVINVYAKKTWRAFIEGLRKQT